MSSRTSLIIQAKPGENILPVGKHDPLYSVVLKIYITYCKRQTSNGMAQ